MILAVNELYTTLYQTVTTDHFRKQIVTVRPHLYRRGAPAGTIKVQIQTNAGVLVAESSTRNIATLGTGTYWHGYANFDVSVQLDKATSYRVAIIAASYTFNASAYVGWCGGFDLGKYAPVYTPTNVVDEPMDLEIWSRLQVRKGIA